MRRSRHWTLKQNGEGLFSGMSMLLSLRNQSVRIPFCQAFARLMPLDPNLAGLHRTLRLGSSLHGADPLPDVQLCATSALVEHHFVCISWLTLRRQRRHSGVHVHDKHFK